MLQENDTTGGEKFPIDANIETYLTLFPENSAIQELIHSCEGLAHLSNGEKKELYVLTIALLFKEQNRKNHRQVIASTEETIKIWSEAARHSKSMPEKIKIAGIIEKFKLELQAQKLRANQAVRDLEQANRNLNLLKVRISLAKPEARRGLERYRERLAEILTGSPAVAGPVDS